MRQITVFDTTLRDGEQAPGASLSPQAKFLVAKALADLGVDVLEAGFPAASVGEAEAVARIAREVRGPTMAALARANGPDVETAAKSLSGALRSRIHVFIATSDRHLERKLRITRSDCLARITASVARATEPTKSSSRLRTPRDPTSTSSTPRTRPPRRPARAP